MTPLNLSKVYFSNKADKVYSDRGIFNPWYSHVNTLKGADEIIGDKYIDSDFGLGVFAGVGTKNVSAIAAADLSRKASIYANGIDNQGSIYTNRGRDIVRGTATAKIAATVQTVSKAIAYADRLNANAIAKTFASIDINVVANGINNSGEIRTGRGSDTLDGRITGSVAAVATATADARAIVQAIAQAPMSDSLTAFAGAIAKSLANATITATGIKNVGGQIITAKGADVISAIATSDSATFTDTPTYSVTNAATPETKALAEAVAEATATAQDKAIAIDNTQGYINLGKGNDGIKVTADALSKAIAINNTRGDIAFGKGRDTIEANATALREAIAVDNDGGYISFGKGRDTIEATADASEQAIAIDNHRGSIKTGQGSDIVKAYATGSDSYGIFGGTINMGDGRDELTASSFGGDVKIKMGDGKDFVEGFGDAKINGGRGFDTLSLGSYKIDDFDISLGANNNKVIFELDDTVMTATKFEQFNFDNGSLSLSYDDLVATL
ncbi:hypothetical protein [Mastigocoleus testarum]|uniref:Uncharacterized protein n=1 Tax=Mastigocoleus testarum BC008 TaxID=371196 RepID=A0A0V7ZU80_9CYAN|nr:hypothetical protein [Mastigocoleus testarum]KST67711.1 hypothetical protein BC008_43945 [Mastigocoleus testarum BC008]